MSQTAIAPQFEVTNQQVLTDAQLLAFIVRGEYWALSEIQERYTRLVISIALKTLNDQASAEEIAQLVFTKVWRHAQDYRVERGKFSSWVSTITHNECVDELRRRARDMTDPGYAESLDQFAANDDSARDMFEQACVRIALQQIPTQERIVIELAFWSGMSHQEIAMYCHSPLGTVKTRLRLGKKRLRLLLQESI